MSSILSGVKVAGGWFLSSSSFILATPQLLGEIYAALTKKARLCWCLRVRLLRLPHVSVGPHVYRFLAPNSKRRKSWPTCEWTPSHCLTLTQPDCFEELYSEYHLNKVLAKSKVHYLGYLMGILSFSVAHLTFTKSLSLSSYPTILPPVTTHMCLSLAIRLRLLCKSSASHLHLVLSPT